jgi:hypothetical protein
MRLKPERCHRRSGVKLSLLDPPFLREPGARADYGFGSVGVRSVIVASVMFALTPSAEERAAAGLMRHDAVD